MRKPSWKPNMNRLLQAGAAAMLITIAGLSLIDSVIAADLSGEWRRLSKLKKSTISVSEIVSLTEDEASSPISGASTIIRTKTGVGFDFNTSELEPGAPYTMWWVTFNRPGRCLTPFQCALVDLSDPRVDAGVFFAGGRVADAFGQATFAGEINYGELPKGDDQVPFPGIESPIKPRAEIHLVVRAHGAAIDDPAALKAQLTEFNGGCPPNQCVDVQVSIHPSPYASKRLH
ncbi:MAG: hypothetical protein AAFW81_03115 [Pseudomonadota bacterium]